MGAAGQREAKMASGGHGRLCSKRHIEGPGGTAGCRSQRDAYGIDKERGIVRVSGGKKHLENQTPEFTVKCASDRSQQKQMTWIYLRRTKSVAWFGESESLGKEVICPLPRVSAQDKGNPENAEPPRCG